jgi:enoyl-CoA hydratase
MEPFPLTEAHGTVVLTLDRPHAISIAGKHALTEALRHLADRRDVRAIILTASHPQAFLVDVAELADMDAAGARAFSAAGHALAGALESLPFPAIGAVEGPALGGGCELLLACDLAYAGAGATFGQIEGMGGVMPGFGGTWRLARRVGFARALEMMMTAAVIDAPTAKSYGLVLDVAPEGRAVDLARDFVERLVKTSAASIAAIKRAAVGGWNASPAVADLLEESAFPGLFGAEQSARMHAFLKQQGQK